MGRSRPALCQVAGGTLVGALSRIVFRYRSTIVYYREAVSQQASRSTVSNGVSRLLNVNELILMSLLLMPMLSSSS